MTRFDSFFKICIWYVLEHGAWWQLQFNQMLFFFSRHTPAALNLVLLLSSGTVEVPLSKALNPWHLHNYCMCMCFPLCVCNKITIEWKGWISPGGISKVPPLFIFFYVFFFLISNFNDPRGETGSLQQQQNRYTILSIRELETYTVQNNVWI